MNPTARMGHTAPFDQTPTNEEVEIDVDAIEQDDAVPQVAASSLTTIPRGKGRIIRDTEGNITGFTLGDEAPEELEEEESGPKAVPMPDHPSATVVFAKTDVVRALEHLSASRSSTKITRHASSHEVTWLKTLVMAYGSDTEAMSKDLKRNIWQKTPGELRRALQKAGGVAKLGAT